MSEVIYEPNDELINVIKYMRGLITSMALRDQVHALIRKPQLDEHHENCLNILEEADQMVHNEVCALTLYLRDNSYWQKKA
jgi:hypothetical protein